jgi:hypothetical protein
MATRSGNNERFAQQQSLVNSERSSRHQSCGSNRATSHGDGMHEKRGDASAKKLLEAYLDQLTELQKAQLARRLGYSSIEMMVAGSTFMTLSDGSAWWLTKDRDGDWTTWNLCAIDPGQ